MLKLELVDLLKIEIPLSVANDIHGPIEYVFFTDVFEDLYGLKLVVIIRHYIQLNALNFFTIVSLFGSDDHAVEFKTVQIWKTKWSLVIPSAFSMSSSNQY